MAKKNKVNEKFIDIVLTDMQIHAIKPTNPNTIDRQAIKIVNSGKQGGGKAFSGKVAIGPDGEWTVIFPLTNLDGNKIRYFVPKGGINLYLSDDAVDKIESLIKNKDAT